MIIVQDITTPAKYHDTDTSLNHRIGDIVHYMYSSVKQKLYSTTYSADSEGYPTMEVYQSTCLNIAIQRSENKRRSNDFCRSIVSTLGS